MPRSTIENGTALPPRLEFSSRPATLAVATSVLIAGAFAMDWASYTFHRDWRTGSGIIKQFGF